MEVVGQNRSLSRSTTSSCASRLLVLRFGEVAGLWHHPQQEEKSQSTHSADNNLNITMLEAYPGQDLDQSWVAARHEISQILQRSGAEPSGDVEAHLGATGQILDKWVAYASVRFVLNQQAVPALQHDSAKNYDPRESMKARLFDHYYQGAKLPKATCHAVVDTLDRNLRTSMLGYRTNRVQRSHLAWDAIKRDCATADPEDLNEYHSLLLYLLGHWLRLDKAQSWLTTRKGQSSRVWTEALHLFRLKVDHTATLRMHRDMLRTYDHRDPQNQYEHVHVPAYHPDAVASRCPEAHAKALDEYRRHWDRQISQQAQTASYTQMQTVGRGQAQHMTRESSPDTCTAS